MISCIWLVFFFFFKQKTAYEMRISDWSSDVCSSDLAAAKDSGNQAQYKGRIQTNKGRKSCDHRKSNRFRDKRQRHGEAGQDFNLVVDFLFEEIGRAHV